MLSVLLLTAFNVSIDSFFCGFSVPQNKKNKYLTVPIIALTVFIMCLIANYGAMLLSSFLTEKTASLGGIILVGVGLFNLFKKDEKTKEVKGGLWQSILSGVAVGLDGSMANLSLSFMGINAFYVPLTIALFHALLVGFGIFLSGKIFSPKLEKISILPSLILIALGVYKTMGFFI